MICTLLRPLRNYIDDMIVAPVAMTLELLAYARDGIRNYEEE